MMLGKQESGTETQPPKAFVEFTTIIMIHMMYFEISIYWAWLRCKKLHPSSQFCIAALCPPQVVQTCRIPLTTNNVNCWIFLLSRRCGMSSWYAGSGLHRPFGLVKIKLQHEVVFDFAACRESVEAEVSWHFTKTHAYGIYQESESTSENGYKYLFL